MPRKSPPPKSLDQRLDDAVEETFPASDPISVSAPEKKGPDGKPIPPKRTGAPEPARKRANGKPPLPSPS